jgi:hypothetical protein
MPLAYRLMYAILKNGGGGVNGLKTIKGNNAAS